MKPNLPVAFLHCLSAPNTPCYSVASNVLSPQMPHDFNLIPSLSSSSQVLGMETARTFDAVVPDQSLLFSMCSVLLLCIVAGVVWANEVVPVSRTKLAISKSRGEVREYLDGLRKNDASHATEEGATEAADQSVIVKNDGRGFERWLFSDWLNKHGAKGGRQKEPALPILKNAKWNSGDNPVLVTAGIMMIGIILASITERVSLP